LTITGPGEKEVRDPTGASVKVADVMRTRLFTISEDTDLRQAALKMQMNKIGSLLVVKGKKLIGIVTDSDYVGLAINLLEQLEEIDPPELDEF
jgi:CBS domain-containing membrane protein